MEWAVAMGTSLLALITYYATSETREETRIDRKIAFIKSQLEDLYGPIIAEERTIMSGYEMQETKLETIRQKGYLASPSFKGKIDEFLQKRDEFMDAAMRVPQDVTPSYGSEEEAQRRKKIVEALEQKADEARAFLLTCGIELIREAKKDYSELMDELRRLSKS